MTNGTDPYATPAGATPHVVPTSAQVVTGVVEEVGVVGDYALIGIASTHVATHARPGQFVAIGVGDGHLHPLRRFFTVTATDVNAEVFRVLLFPGSPATRWLARRQVGDTLDVFGPLGNGFPPTSSGERVLYVGGGHGAATLLQAVIDAADRGSLVDVVLGAASADRLYGVAEMESAAQTVQICTMDGSIGTRGHVLPLVEERLASGVDLVMACGPMPMMGAVNQLTSAYDTRCLVATEAHMACAYGVCMSCVLPMLGADGQTTMARTCVEGPVLDARRVRWNDLGTVPSDTVGASS